MKIKLSKSQWEFVGRKAGWMRTAQIPYQSEEVLKEVGTRGKDDKIDWNKYDKKLPEEDLKEVLRRGTTAKEPIWNQLAEEYKSNMNNPETIVKILKIGEDNWLSKAAAANAKCPPEVLAEVLRQGRDNGVSRAAAQNPNCPPEAKQEWLRIINPNRQAGKTKRMKKEAVESLIKSKKPRPEPISLIQGGINEINKGLQSGLMKLKQSLATNPEMTQEEMIKIMASVSGPLNMNIVSYIVNYSYKAGTHGRKDDWGQNTQA